MGMYDDVKISANFLRRILSNIRTAGKQKGMKDF